MKIIRFNQVNLTDLPLDIIRVIISSKRLSISDACHFCRVNKFYTSTILRDKRFWVTVAKGRLTNHSDRLQKILDDPTITAQDVLTDLKRFEEAVVFNKYENFTNIYTTFVPHLLRKFRESPLPTAAKSGYELVIRQLVCSSENDAINSALRNAARVGYRDIFEEIIKYETCIVLTDVALIAIEVGYRDIFKRLLPRVISEHNIYRDILRKAVEFNQNDLFNDFITHVIGNADTINELFQSSVCYNNEYVFNSLLPLITDEDELAVALSQSTALPSLYMFSKTLSVIKSRNYEPWDVFQDMAESGKFEFLKLMTPLFVRDPVVLTEAYLTARRRRDSDIMGYLRPYLTEEQIDNHYTEYWI